MKNILSQALAIILFMLSTAASAQWVVPWNGNNNGWGGNNWWGDGMGDFNVNFRMRMNMDGWNQGFNGFNPSYYYNNPPFRYNPYGRNPYAVPYYSAPVVPLAPASPLK